MPHAVKRMNERKREWKALMKVWDKRGKSRSFLIQGRKSFTLVVVMATVEPANETVMEEGVKERQKEKKQCDGKAKPQKQCRADFLSSRHHFLFRQSALCECEWTARGSAKHTCMHVNNSVESNCFHTLKEYTHTPCRGVNIAGLLPLSMTYTHFWSTDINTTFTWDYMRGVVDRTKYVHVWLFKWSWITVYCSTSVCLRTTSRVYIFSFIGLGL